MGSIIEKNKYGQLEDFGVMTDYPTKPLPLYNYKAMMDYCREHKIRPAELSDAVRDSFQIGFC